MSAASAGVRIFNVTFDAVDPRRLAAFWARLLSATPAQVSDDLVRLAPDDPRLPHLLFLKVDDPRSAKNRIHLDLAAGDVDAELSRMLALGAVPVDPLDEEKPARRQANGLEWVVLADPEGNQFCVGAEPVQPPAG